MSDTMTTMASRLDIILGCMLSGKSTELLRRCQKANAIGKRVAFINHSLDTRHPDDVILTHSKQTQSAIKTDSLMGLFRETDWSQYDVVGIDEAQFFDDLYDFVRAMESLNKHLIISGLDGDFLRRPFGQILQCIPLCDTVVKLHAYDMLDKDFTPAIFSWRIAGTSSGNSQESNQIQVGASESYIAVSRKNYLMLSSSHGSHTTS